MPHSVGHAGRRLGQSLDGVSRAPDAGNSAHRLSCPRENAAHFCNAVMAFPAVHRQGRNYFHHTDRLPKLRHQCQARGDSVAKVNTA